jgi:hypothetical protein
MAKRRLKTFYDHYAPEKSEIVEGLAEAYSCNPRALQKLFLSLEEQYGPEPDKIFATAALLRTAAKDSIGGSESGAAREYSVGSGEREEPPTTTDRIHRLLVTYEPSCAEDVQLIFSVASPAKTREEILEELVEMYGPEPSDSSYQQAYSAWTSKNMAAEHVRKQKHTLLHTFETDPQDPYHLFGPLAAQLRISHLSAEELGALRSIETHFPTLLQGIGEHCQSDRSTEVHPFPYRAFNTFCRAEELRGAVNVTRRQPACDSALCNIVVDHGLECPHALRGLTYSTFADAVEFIYHFYARCGDDVSLALLECCPEKKPGDQLEESILRLLGTWGPQAESSHPATEALRRCCEDVLRLPSPHVSVVDLAALRYIVMTVVIEQSECAERCSIGAEERACATGVAAWHALAPQLFRHDQVEHLLRTGIAEEETYSRDVIFIDYCRATDLELNGTRSPFFSYRHANDIATSFSDPNASYVERLRTQQRHRNAVAEAVNEMWARFASGILKEETGQFRAAFDVAMKYRQGEAERALKSPPRKANHRCAKRRTGLPDEFSKKLHSAEAKLRRFHEHKSKTEALSARSPPGNYATALTPLPRGPAVAEPSPAGVSSRYSPLKHRIQSASEDKHSPAKSPHKKKVMAAISSKRGTFSSMVLFKPS